jgi:hypothetical protein
MLNCVRFGVVAGRERALVAGQNGLVYVFNVPTWSSAARVPVCPLLARFQHVACQEVNTLQRGRGQ